MKRLLLILLVLIYFIGISSATTYNIVNDSFTSSSSPNTNYGTNTNLQLSSAPNQWSYIYIDLGTTGLDTAYLNLYCWDSCELLTNITVYKTTEFTETTITHNNMPALSDIITSNFTINPTYNTWNNITLVNPSRYIAIKKNVSNSCCGLFYSAEGANYNPYLNYTEPTQPILLTPSNTSSTSTTYPPNYADVSFTWYDTESVGYELIVAEDSLFNYKVLDVYTSADAYTYALTTGKKYYWKVRQYNDTALTYGATSKTFEFTLTREQSQAQQSGYYGVEGIVYELINGEQTAIKDATVYAYNNTHGFQATTGSNGYYLFTGLKNASNYTIFAEKQNYVTSSSTSVQIPASMTEHNILLVSYVSPYYPNYVYETIQVENIFGTAYVGATITLYEGDEIDVYETHTTDTIGQTIFKVTKDQKYRVTASGGGISTPFSGNIYGKEEIYKIIIMAGFPTGGDRNSDISANLTVIDYNATYKNLTLIYNDTKSTTSAVNFYAKNLSTLETCTQTSASSVVTLKCTVLASGTYQFGYNATSTTYGFFKQDKIINFGAGKPDTPTVDTNIDKTLLQWTSIALLVLIASLFGISSVKWGVIIVPMVAMVLWVFGWFEPAAGNIILSFSLLATALILGILIYMRMSENKVAYQ